MRILFYVIGITSIFLICSCSLSQGIKNGDVAFERKQFSVAIEMLLEEFEESRNNSSKARKSYLLGKSYENTKNDDEALYWYEKSAELGFGPEAVRDLAYAYKRKGLYKQAAQTFKNLNQAIGNRPEIAREVAICQEAINWSKEKNQAYTIDRSYVNSVQADYAPVMYEDEYVVFTSDRGTSTGSDRYGWTGNKFSDLYLMSKNGGIVQPFEDLFNTSDNEGTVAFNVDYTEIFFTRCYAELPGDAFCKIMYSNRFDGFWSDPVPLPFQKNGMNYGHPTMIEKDSVLVFAARIDNTVSDYDLFYSVRLEDNTWSEPDRFPDIINTKGNEFFPSGDGDTLYFSSDFHPGLGGLDIFKTYLDKNRKWTPPKRLPPPINSSSDDFGFEIDHISEGVGNIIRKGYFSSTRAGVGDDDIYSFTQIKLEKEEPEVVKEKPPKLGRNISYYLAGRVLEPIYEIKNDPNSAIIDYRPLDFARVRVSRDTSIIGTYLTDKTGVFLEEIGPDMDLSIYAGKNRYLNKSIVVSTKNIEVDSLEEVVTINVEIILNRIFKDREIVLSDIYYDLDKAEIREDAKPTLDRLVKILEDNPDIRLQLSSHTDCRADDDYNLDLSQRRAISAVKYMISKGIENRRLVPKGYGETLLAIDCDCEACTEEEHQTNRRTTFKVIS